MRLGLRAQVNPCSKKRVQNGMDVVEQTLTIGRPDDVCCHVWGSKHLTAFYSVLPHKNYPARAYFL
jgi:hypothetical protein